MSLTAMARPVLRALSVPPVLPVTYLLGADGSVTRTARLGSAAAGP
jgi:hypothetical protein